MLLSLVCDKLTTSEDSATQLLICEALSLATNTRRTYRWKSNEPYPSVACLGNLKALLSCRAPLRLGCDQLPANMNSHHATQFQTVASELYI